MSKKPRPRRRRSAASVEAPFQSVMEQELSAPHTKSGKLQRACLALLREHQQAGTLPTNGRFLFYELEQRGIVPKHYDDLVHQPAQDVTNALIQLRQRGLVPWSWFTDESRSVDIWPYAASVFEYAVAAIDDARIDCWDGEPPPLIICESRATAGVLRRIHRATWRQSPPPADRLVASSSPRSPRCSPTTTARCSISAT